MKKRILIFIMLLSVGSNAQPQSYSKLKAEIATQRSVFAEAYLTADSLYRDSLLNASYRFVFDALVNKVFSAWYGTVWDFNGHSETPGQGSIACGYFITTTLRDVGLDIPRVRWAQMGSERVIRKLTSDVKRFHNTPMSRITEYINSRGNGLYIVGLDYHVGFIVKTDSLMQLVHANYYQPQVGVMAEPLMGWNPLNDSKYRVIGKILDNDMLDKWLTGYKYE